MTEKVGDFKFKMSSNISMNVSKLLSKNLFASTSANDESARFESLCDQLQVGENTSLMAKNTKKEIHQKRLEGLKKELEYLKETNWKYKSADELIGL